MVRAFVITQNRGQTIDHLGVIMAIVFSSKISDSANEQTISNYYTGEFLSFPLSSFIPPSILCPSLSRTRNMGQR
jgi:hypothetical protein